MDKRRKKAVKTQGVKNTLETPIVRLYLDFITTPENLKAGQKKNLKQFMAENHIGSYTTLQNWEKITGFHEEVLRRKNDYIAQEKLEMLELGKSGLKEVAVKHVLKKEVVDRSCQIREVKEDVDPDVRSCERLIQLGGGDIVDNINITGTDAISAAAKRITEKEDAV